MVKVYMTKSSMCILIGQLNSNLINFSYQIKKMMFFAL
ncbi:hypothetical protein K034_4233 [Acinetobacter baumannii 42057_3]|nr:hypothetical protein K034_4233 [Acinetobacter baumannii 42057_3]